MSDNIRHLFDGTDRRLRTFQDKLWEVIDERSHELSIGAVIGTLEIIKNDIIRNQPVG